MSKKAWIIFAAVCVVLLVGLVYFSNKDSVSVGNVDILKEQPASQDSGNIADHIFGNKDSKVTLIEYGDYQCPGCGSAYPNLKAVAEKYKGQLAFVFRNFPLTSIHPNALAAAAAAEAAGLQGKYWEMHDKLYEGQNSWQGLNASQRTNFFASYANELKLDIAKFKSDLTNPDINKKIDYDIALGKKARVTGTPTIYLNGKEVDNDTWSDASKLDDRVVKTLKANGIQLPDGTVN